MVNLEKEQLNLNSLLKAYKNKEDNDIYFHLENIAKCNYLKKDNCVKYFQELFFT